MKKIAIPIFENRISNRLDSCESIILYFAERNQIKSYKTVHIVRGSPIIKLNMLLALEMDVLICNGITDFYARKLSDSNIQVIPWISGEVQEVIGQYLNGSLRPFNVKEPNQIKKNM
jgi:predicted Fe-Mo cluster-binding NifX family protein